MRTPEDFHGRKYPLRLRRQGTATPIQTLTAASASLSRISATEDAVRRALSGTFQFTPPARATVPCR